MRTDQYYSSGEIPGESVVSDGSLIAHDRCEVPSESISNVIADASMPFEAYVLHQRSRPKTLSGQTPVVFLVVPGTSNAVFGF